jgi:hypothetical protein
MRSSDVTANRNSLLKSSVGWRFVWLGTAYLWSSSLVALTFAYHFDQPSTIWMTVNGHNFYTHYSWTLWHSDPVSVEIAATVIGLTLLGGTIDLTYRVWRRSADIGVLCVAAGGLLAMFSLFGLIRGVIAIAPIGGLVVASGMPIKARTHVGVFADPWLTEQPTP